jgi:hypothetical protein
LDRRRVEWTAKLIVHAALKTQKFQFNHSNLKLYNVL